MPAMKEWTIRKAHGRVRRHASKQQRSYSIVRDGKLLHSSSRSLRSALSRTLSVHCMQHQIMRSDLDYSIKLSWRAIASGAGERRPSKGS